MATRNPNLSTELRSKKFSGLDSPRLADADNLIGYRDDTWFTGKHPTVCRGFDSKEGVLRSLPVPNLRRFTRESVLEYFDNAWTLTEILFGCLQSKEAFVVQPYHQLRHPMMFYYGHPAVLYINKFRVAGILDAGIDSVFETLFETGVDEMSWDDLSRARDDWPSVEAVTQYRKTAYAILKDVILYHPCLNKGEVTMDDPAWAIFMSFEHERIHIETSSVLLRELPLTHLIKPNYWPHYHPSIASPSAPVPKEGQDFPSNDFITVGGETVVLGKAHNYPSFGWDNEYGAKRIQVAPFRASKFKITNGEFLAFVRAGGYTTPRFWSTEGWKWRTFRNVKWPTFWVLDGPAGLHRYKLRLMFDTVDMRWDWPVDVNYHEARAFCSWRNERDGEVVAYRLITEAEHQLICSTRDRMDAYRFCKSNNSDSATDDSVNPDAAMLAGGATAEQVLGFNLHLAHGSQSPVESLPASKKGFYDTMGNAWEWAEDHFAAFPGFKVHPYYEDFSAPCFAGKHQMILGGSFISTGQLASKYARYQFRPHFFQHVSFRVVQSVVTLSNYNAALHSPSLPITPFVETTCMDSAPPYVGEGPCCSVARATGFTPTKAQSQTASDLICTLAHAQKVAHSDHEKGENGQCEVVANVYARDLAMWQHMAACYGPVERAFGLLSSLPELLQEAKVSLPLRCASSLAGAAAAAHVIGGTVLDLGCQTGASSFELLRSFSRVVGIDASARCVEIAEKLRAEGSVEFPMLCGDGTFENVTATRAEDVDVANCMFVQGDVCTLPAEIASQVGRCDAILAVEVIDTVPQPIEFLHTLSSALSPGGIALLTSASCLGCSPTKGQECARSALEAEFEVLSERDAVYVLPQTPRRWQLTVTREFVVQKRSC